MNTPDCLETLQEVRKRYIKDARGSGIIGRTIIEALSHAITLIEAYKSAEGELGPEGNMEGFDKLPPYRQGNLVGWNACRAKAVPVVAKLKVDLEIAKLALEGKDSRIKKLQARIKGLEGTK